MERREYIPNRSQKCSGKKLKGIHTFGLAL